MDGTLLFREDFGGNDPSDPRVSQTPIPGMTYNQLLDDHYDVMRSLCSYLVTKTGYCNGDTSATNLPQNRRSQWHLQDDHTYPNDYTRGYMMEIDGRGDNAVFYTTTIDGLCDGSKLTFSAYVANVMTWGQYVGRPGYYAYPRLKFVLSDPVSNAELATYDTGDIPFDSAFINDYDCWKQSSKWRLVGMNFTVPNGQNRIKLTISNNATGNIGNDFAIDDIEIRLCAPPVTIDGDHEICANSSELLTANFTNDGTFTEPVAYKWLFSPDSLTWVELSETSNVLSNPNVRETDSGWFKVAVAGADNIDRVNCCAMSEPFKLTVKECEEELCMDGTLLFREDFGGNSPDDPDISMETVPGMDNNYHNSGNSKGPGRYTIRKEGWNNGVQWHRQDDHTYFGDKTRGYLLEVDGLGEKVPFYSKTIDGLCAGSKLTFSAYVVNVHYAGQVVYFDNHGYNYVYPRMKFVLKNPETGELLAEKSTGDIQPDWRYGTPETWRYARDNTLSADWQLIGMNFTVPEGVESIQMFIYNDVDHNGSGNDFALDDIEIRLCLPPVTITSPHEVCEGEDYTFTVDFTNDGSMAEPLEYQWYFSNDSNTWAPVIGVTERDWHIPNIQQGSGWFKLAVAGAGNIDRVNCRAMSEPFKLTVKECETPYFIVEQTLSACHEDSVLYRGKKYAAPGYYCDTVEAMNAIDTIYRLTVNDNRSFKDVSLSIMSGSLIPPIGVITESGVYHFTFTNAAGCDSIVTWYVTVTERCIDQREEFYLIGPDQTYYWAGQTLVEAGEYRDTLLHQTNEECDTVVRLHLDILAVDELDWKSDCDGFDLHLNLSDPVEKVRIAFSPEARKAGLRDTILMLHAAQADLHLPNAGAHAGTYSCRVSLMNGYNTLFSAPFDFTLRYPSSVLEQAWNDVLAVLTRDFNGGYEFVAYQWYENGVPLTGETHSYLYKPLVMGGEYSALLTEADGTQRMTCPLIASGQREISLYPLIVPARQVMKCRVPEESEMLLHDALGRIVGYYRLPAGDTQIIAPGTAGVYIARIICLSDNKEHPYKLIVR